MEIHDVTVTSSPLLQIKGTRDSGPRVRAEQVGVQAPCYEHRAVQRLL